jgi:hypothetical protein
MSHLFDSGYGAEPFSTLVRNYPEADVYPPGQFRVEWGRSFIEDVWMGRHES